MSIPRLVLKNLITVGLIILLAIIGIPAYGWQWWATLVPATLSIQIVESALDRW